MCTLTVSFHSFCSLGYKQIPRSGSLSDFRSKPAYLQNQQIGSMAKMLFLPAKQGQVSCRLISCPLLLKFFSIISPYFTIKTVSTFAPFIAEPSATEVVVILMVASYSPAESALVIVISVIALPGGTSFDL